MTNKVEYSSLMTGFEFTPSIFIMAADTVTAYLKATQDDNPLYRDNIVPPMAIAAMAMGAMAEKFNLIPG